eukprot:359982-Chlamydomonas_euryale.AAC.1
MHFSCPLPVTRTLNLVAQGACCGRAVEAMMRSGCMRRVCPIAAPLTPFTARHSALLCTHAA